MTIYLIKCNCLNLSYNLLYIINTQIVIIYKFMIILKAKLLKSLITIYKNYKLYKNKL